MSTELVDKEIVPPVYEGGSEILHDHPIGLQASTESLIEILELIVQSDKCVYDMAVGNYSFPGYGEAGSDKGENYVILGNEHSVNHRVNRALHGIDDLAPVPDPALQGQDPVSQSVEFCA